MCNFSCLPGFLQESLVVFWLLFVFFVCICCSHLPFVSLPCLTPLSHWLTPLCFACSCALHAIELEVPECMKWSKCPLHTSLGPWALEFLLVLLHQWLFKRYLAQLLQRPSVRSELSWTVLLLISRHGEGREEEDTNHALSRKSAYHWGWYFIN